MRYNYDEQGNLGSVTWRTLQDAVVKRCPLPKDKRCPKNQCSHIGRKLWINPQEYIDKQVKKYYNDAIRIANTIKTSLLTDADKESYALEGLYDAAGSYDPTRKNAETGKTASFTTYLMMRIRHVILREKHLAEMQKRCSSVEIPESDFVQQESNTTPELNFDKKKRRKYMVDIPNSATNDRWDEESKTAFETYHKPEVETPFDLNDVMQKLIESKGSLSETQFKILKHLIEDGMSGAEIARQIGVSRQAVNLHLKVIRQRVKEVLAKEAPSLNLGE